MQDRDVLARFCAVRTATAEAKIENLLTNLNTSQQLQNLNAIVLAFEGALEAVFPAQMIASKRSSSKLLKKGLEKWSKLVPPLQSLEV